MFVDMKMRYLLINTAFLFILFYFMVYVYLIARANKSKIQT